MGTDNIEKQFIDERRSAAEHEAGHLTIAMQELGEGSCCIFRKSQFDDWEGTTQWETLGPTVKKIQLIAVAGPVAQYKAIYPDSSCEQCAAEILGGRFSSSSDRAQFPPDQELPSLVKRVIEMLDRHRRFFEWAVRILETNQCIPPDAASREFESLQVELSDEK